MEDSYTDEIRVRVSREMFRELKLQAKWNHVRLSEYIRRKLAEGISHERKVIRGIEDST